MLIRSLSPGQRPETPIVDGETEKRVTSPMAAPDEPFKWHRSMITDVLASHRCVKFQLTTLIVFIHNLLSSTYFWYFRSATLLKNQLKDQQAAENAANGSSGGGGHKSSKPSFHALWEQEFRKIHPNSTFTSNNLSVHFWTWRKQQVNRLFGVSIK